MRTPTAAQVRTLAWKLTHPPLRDVRFWVILVMVFGIAGVHLWVDLNVSAGSGAFPTGLPVILLIVPVGYAAIAFGLTGAVATGILAVLVWLPDLTLPNDQGHVGDDVINLAVILLVAIFFGLQIESERAARARAESETASRMAAEARYRQLFETNRAPMLVLDDAGIVTDANPASDRLFDAGVVGRVGAAVLGAQAPVTTLAGRVLTLPDGRDYRLEVASLPVGDARRSVQVVLEDVTEERRASVRASHFAELVVEAEEAQRLRLSLELHDEPLQLFLHLARRLETLAGVSDLPDPVVQGLGEARVQALEAASRLRTLARDLRPPALDELGLVAAVSSFVADAEEGPAGAGVELRSGVLGDPARLPAEIELGAFRIAQEAVNNALHHARPSHVAVTLHFRPSELAVTVSDDGCGFSPELVGTPDSRQLGLLGMHERARLLGGALDVHSAPGQGTEVTAVIPLNGRVPNPG